MPFQKILNVIFFFSELSKATTNKENMRMKKIMNAYSPAPNKTSNISEMHGRSELFFEIHKMDERLLIKKEVADLLQVSIKMIDRKVLMNEIPYFKVGRLVRFCKKEILAWAKESITKG
jgi:excisionase family DNA binding protein